MEHAKCETPDLAKQNLEKLKALFPGVVTEAGAAVGVLLCRAARGDSHALRAAGRRPHRRRFLARPGADSSRAAFRRRFSA